MLSVLTVLHARSALIQHGPPFLMGNVSVLPIGKHLMWTKCVRNALGRKSVFVKQEIMTVLFVLTRQL